MKKKENVLDKVLHFSEDAASGLTGQGNEKAIGKGREAHSRKKDNINKHKDVTPIWNAKKRKTHP